MVQGALAVGVLLVGLLAVWAVAGRSVDRCPSEKSVEQLRCVLAATPSADFNAAVVPAGTDNNPPLPISIHNSPLPSWWIHGFNRLVLPLYGWSFSPDSTSPIPFLDADGPYCRADICPQLVDSQPPGLGYTVIAW